MNLKTSAPVLVFLAALAACAEPEAPVNVEALSEQVRTLLELPTVEHLYREVVYIDENRSFLMFRTGTKRLLFSLELRVQAGIDLQHGFTVAPIEPNGVAVVIPEPTILEVDALEETIRQYIVEERGENITWLEYSDEIEMAKGRVRADAIRRGILEEADARARRLLQNLFREAGFDEVTFVRTPAPQL
jgi:hypothetical protein